MAGAALVQCTFFGNAAPQGGNVSSDCGGNVSLANCIVASSVEGEGFFVDDSSGATIVCSDIHGNAGGDWVSSIEGLLGQDGNICEDPLFCDPDGGDFTLAAGSPCLPDFHQDCDLMGAHGLGCGLSTALPPPEILANGVRLFSNYPNPFNPQTTIAFELPKQESVNLRVFDMAARLVKELVRGAVSTSGRHEVVWDGRDDAGRQVASGTYFYLLEAGNYSETKRMVLVK